MEKGKKELVLLEFYSMKSVLILFIFFCIFFANEINMNKNEFRYPQQGIPVHYSIESSEVSNETRTILSVASTRFFAGTNGKVVTSAPMSFSRVARLLKRKL
jgi:hypothetical protein